MRSIGVEKEKEAGSWALLIDGEGECRVASTVFGKELRYEARIVSVNMVGKDADALHLVMLTDQTRQKLCCKRSDMAAADDNRHKVQSSHTGVRGAIERKDMVALSKVPFFFLFFVIHCPDRFCEFPRCFNKHMSLFSRVFPNILTFPFHAIR